MRSLILIGKISRRCHKLLATLWDQARAGVEFAVFKFRGFIYTTCRGQNGPEIHITSQLTGAFLGKVVKGELFQCA